MMRSTCEYQVTHSGLYGDGMCGRFSDCPACGGCEFHCNGTDCVEDAVGAVRLGTLKEGAGFRTLLTDAFGIVRDVYGPFAYPSGLRVDLTYPDGRFITKDMHRNVLVKKEAL